MSTYAKSALTALVVSLLAWTGCASMSSGGPCSGEVLDFGKLARAIWQIESTVDPQSIPDEERSSSPRLAIVEFTLEYVAAPSEKLDIGTSMELELPSVLYPGFTKKLREFGRSTVPLSSVTSAAAYGKLKGKGLNDIDVLEARKSEGAGIRFPAQGLLALDDGQQDTDETLRELLKELEADAALQVRLRVSVRDGRATIEKGSIFRVVGPRESGVLRSQKTLQGIARVVETAQAGEGEPPVLAVSSSRYVRSITRLFGPAISTAIIAAGAPLDAVR